MAEPTLTCAVVGQTDSLLHIVHAARPICAASKTVKAAETATSFLSNGERRSEAIRKMRTAAETANAPKRCIK